MAPHDAKLRELYPERDDDDPSFAQPRRPRSASRTREGAFFTRWAMVGIGLAAWLTAIALPGYQWPLMLLGIALVVWAVYGLLTEP